MIPDDNLKLALLDALVEQGKLATLVQRVKAKRKGDGYRLEKGVRSALLAHAPSPAELVSIREVDWSSSSRLIYAIFEYWDGEDGAFDIRDLRGIEACASLEKLDLALVRWPDVLDLSPLAGLPKLRSLSIRAGTVDDLSPLGELARLETLRLPFVGSDLRPLGGLARLRTLELGNATQVEDLSPLGGLLKLSRVEIVRKQADEEPGDLLAKKNPAVVKALAKRGTELVIDDIRTPVREFADRFGDPAPKTGVPLSKLGLEGVEFLEELAREVGTGVFRDGAFSVCSVRELGLDLAPWRKKVEGFPKNAKHFATNWLGEMFFLGSKGRVWKLYPHFAAVEEIEPFRETPFLEGIGAVSHPQRGEEFSKLRDWRGLGREGRPKLRPVQVCTLDDPVKAGEFNAFQFGFRGEDLPKTLERLAARVLA
jgi:hypothetical protein